MKKIYILAVLLILFAISPVFAFEDDGYKKALGFHVGHASGNGYSYRVFFGPEENHALQFVFGAMTSGTSKVKFTDRVYSYGAGNEFYDSKKGQKTSASFGLSYLNILHVTDHSRFYINFGASYLYSRRNEYLQRYVLDSSSYYNATGDPEKKVKNNDVFTFGMGPALSLIHI